LVAIYTIKNNNAIKNAATIHVGFKIKEAYIFRKMVALARNYVLFPLKY
jgi:hypothetical protein